MKKYDSDEDYDNNDEDNVGLLMRLRKFKYHHREQYFSKVDYKEQITEEKIIKCTALIKKGTQCDHNSNIILTFLDESNRPQIQHVCGLHAKSIEKKAKETPDNYKEFKVEKTKIKPK